MGLRKLPAPAVVARLSRDGEVRIEFVRGIGSFEVCTGILDGRGRPLGLLWRVSSMVLQLREVIQPSVCAEWLQ